MENVADKIIKKFGGLTSLAKALGHRHVTTVQGWKRRGVIPARQQGEVLAAARRLKVSIAPADFFAPTLAERLPRKSRAA